MSKTELTDNLTFASALQMLKQLVEQGLLTAEEGRSPAESWSGGSGPPCFSPDSRTVNCPIFVLTSRCYFQIALL